MAEQNQEYHPADVFRGLYPADAQQTTATVPDHPTHVLLANDFTIADFQKVRYELRYLAEIFKSWKENYPKLKAQLSLQLLLSMDEGREVRCTRSTPTTASTSVFLVSEPRREIHYYLELPLSNNGYMYRIIDDAADVGLRNL
jgi:hypothetical protein